MRKILLALLALPVLTYGQFRVVSNASFVTVNDSTYTASITAKPDLTGFGYTAFNIEVGDVVFTAVENAYKIDSVWGKTRTTANIRVQDYNILGDSMTNQTYGKPMGQFVIARLNANRTIPQAPIAVLAASPQLNAAIDAHNAKVAVTVISQLVDSTRLNATGDTLYYYQNDSLIGVAAIKAGLWTNSLIDLNTIYYDDNVAIGNDTSYGSKLYVEGNRIHLNNIGNAGSFYLTNDSTGVGGNNGLYMYLANQDGNLVLFENARLNLGVNNSLKFTLNDTAVGIFTNFPEFPLEIASTKGIIIPNGTTAERPTYVADGLLRYNEDSSRFEYYSTATTNWIQITDTSGYNFSLSLGLDSVLTITDGNSTLTANLAATFDNTDTSGYNILLAYTNDTLFITDGNSTLSVEIPTIIDSTRLNTIGDTLYYYQDGTLIGAAAIKAGLWNQSLRDVGTIYYDDAVAIGTDSAFSDVDLVVYDSSGIGLLQIVSGNVTSYLRLTDGLDSWDIRNVQGSGDVFRISRSTAGDGQRGFLIDTLNRVGINVSTIDLLNSDADLYIDRTSGVLISRGTTLQRPTTTDNGLLRFNTDSTRYEYWDNGTSSWIQIMDTSGYNLSLTFANDTLYLVDGNSELKVELPQVADTDDQTLSIVGKDSIAISEGNQVRLPIYYNVDEGTYQAEINGTKILLLGQENLYRVKNQTGSAIPAGTVVGFAGTLGASGIILVSPFNANGSLPARYVVGITPLEIPNDSLGYVTDFGKIRGITTDSNAVGTEAWVNGDILWADPNNIGGLTKTEPQAPNLKLPLAAVVYAAANNGELLVRVETGESLYDDNDVQIDTANITDNQFLVWDDGQQRWENGYVKVDSITVFGEGTTADPLYVDTFKLVTIDYLNTLLDTSITVTSADTVKRKIENTLIGKGVEANWFNIDSETDSCNLDYIDFYVYQRSNTIDLGPYQFKLYYSNNVTHPDSNMLITTFDAYNDSTVRVDLGDFTLTRPTVLYIETPFVGNMKLFNTLIADYTFVCNTGVTNPIVFTGGEAKDTIVASGFIVAGAFRVSTDQTSTISTQDSLKIGAPSVSISEVPSEALDVIGKMRLAVDEGVGDFSVYVGNLAGKTHNNVASNNSVGVGWRALEDFSSGAGNTAIGAATLANLTTGSFNTALGWLAGLDLQGGSNNILIGTRMPFAGVLTDAYKSIYIGDSIVASSTTPIEEIVIGSKITGAGNNTVTIGNPSNTKLKSNRYIFNVDQDTTGLNGYLLTYNGTSGEIELQVAPASSPWSESGNYIYTTSDSVGIGTSSPIAALDVRGRIDLFSPSSSTYVGRYAGNDMVSTNQKFNVGIGIGSMRYDTIGKYNTAVGGFTLQYYDGIENAYNTAIGYGVLDAVGLTGVWNTGVGANSLGATTTGQANTVLGFNSLASNTTGSNNTVVGAQSYAGNSGGNNTIVGYGIDNGGTGSNNIAIGYNADLLGAAATNQIIIGSDIQSAGDSIALIGNAMKQLRVNKYIFNTDQDTTGLDGYVLTYDAATSEIELKPSTGGITAQQLTDTLDANTRGFLTQNQTITLTDDATGSGTTSISVTVVDDSHNHTISTLTGIQDSLNAKLDTAALSPLTLYQQVFTANGTDSTYTFTETSLPDSIANIIVLQNGLTIDKAYISVTAPNIVRLSYLPQNNDRIVIIVFKGTGILGGGGGGISSVVTDGVTILGDGTSGSEIRTDTTNYIATKGDLGGYVTTTTTQSISGEKTFTNDNTILSTTSAGGFPKLTINNTQSGSNLANYFPSLEFKSISDQNAGVKDTIARIVALGSGNGSTYPQSASIEFLGTTLTSDRAGADILFKTNFTTSGSNSVNTERMRITSAGRVGIGTASPTVTLDVNGSMAVDTSTLYVDAVNNRVGIGTSSPSGNLEINAPITSIQQSQFIIKDGSESGFFRITEGSSGANRYLPNFYGISSGIDDYGISFLGGPISTRDIGNSGRAAITFEGTKYDTATNTYGALTNTHLFNFTNFGTSRMFMLNNGDLGIGTTTPSEKLDVDGKVRIRNLTGTTTNDVFADANGVLATSSDERLKIYHSDIDNAINIINNLYPKYFYWKDNPIKRDLGFYAQEVNAVLPEGATPMNNDGFYGLNSRAIIAVTVKAIQEQQAIIESQQQEIDQFKTSLISQTTLIQQLLSRIEALENK